MRKRMKRVLCLVLSLTAAAGLMLVRDSAAWFDSQTGSPLGQTMSIGKMNYTCSGSLQSIFKQNGTSFIITDENLLMDVVNDGSANDGQITGNAITITNYSLIDTEVRFQITYTSPLDGSDAVFSPNASTGIATDSTSHVTTAVDSVLEAQCPDYWSYSNGYFVYSSNNNAVVPPMGQTAQSYTVLSYLAFSEEAMHSQTYAGLNTTQGMHVTVTIQARQSDIMEWADVGVLSLA